MADHLITFAIAFVAAVVIAPPAIALIKKLKFGQKILDIGPKWHSGKQNTPTMGGVIFILATLIPLLIFTPRMIETGDWRSLYLFGFALTFGIIGFIDDFAKIRNKRNQGITAVQKLLLQAAAATLFLSLLRHGGYLPPTLYIPFMGYTLTLHWGLHLAFCVFLTVGFVNAVNLTDGIDGLCTSVTLVVSLFFSVMFYLWQNGAIGFSAALCGGLLGFLLFNRYPAKVFMGDSGSLFLGGAVCAMAFALEIPLVLLPVGIIYLIETLSDIIQVLYYKASGGKRIFKMAPIHHHFEMTGWSENKITIVFSMITVLFCVLTILSLLR